MKRFAAAALVLAFAYAQSTEDEMNDKKEEAEDQLADAWEATSDWFSSRQEPVAFSSLEASGDQCSLTGHYGWFSRLGLDFVFIRETVGDCAMAEGNIALTWAEMDGEDEEYGATIEGFYCMVTYRDGKPAA